MVGSYRVSNPLRLTVLAIKSEDYTTAPQHLLIGIDEEFLCPIPLHVAHCTVNGPLTVYPYCLHNQQEYKNLLQTIIQCFFNSSLLQAALLSSEPLNVHWALDFFPMNSTIILNFQAEFTANLSRKQAN